MKDYKDVASSVFQRREDYLKEKSRKRSVFIKCSSAALSCCLMILLGFGIWRSDLLSTRPPQDTGITDITDPDTTTTAETTVTTAAGSTSAAVTTVRTTASAAAAASSSRTNTAATEKNSGSSHTTAAVQQTSATTKQPTGDSPLPNDELPVPNVTTSGHSTTSATTSVMTTSARRTTPATTSRVTAPIRTTPLPPPVFTTSSYVTSAVQTTAWVTTAVQTTSWRPAFTTSGHGYIPPVTTSAWSPPVTTTYNSSTPHTTPGQTLPISGFYFNETYYTLTYETDPDTDYTDEGCFYYGIDPVPFKLYPYKNEDISKICLISTGYRAPRYIAVTSDYVLPLPQGKPKPEKSSFYR